MRGLPQWTTRQAGTHHVLTGRLDQLRDRRLGSAAATPPLPPATATAAAAALPHRQFDPALGAEDHLVQQLVWLPAVGDHVDKLLLVLLLVLLLPMLLLLLLE